MVHALAVHALHRTEDEKGSLPAGADSCYSQHLHAESEPLSRLLKGTGDVVGIEVSADDMWMASASL